jgi:hypothetical protein
MLSAGVNLMSKAGTDYRDIGNGAYDPVSKDGLPQPEQVKDKTTPHQAAQGGADVRAEALPGTEPVLPEGSTRPRKGPLNPKTGRPQVEVRSAVLAYPWGGRCASRN